MGRVGPDPATARQGQRTPAPRLDPRAERTRRALRQALVALAADGGLAALNVSAVTRHAGITRQTFYDHYRDLDGLVFDALREELEGLSEAARLTGELAGTPTGGGVPTGLVRLTRYLHERRALLSRVLGPGGNRDVQVWLHEQLARDIEAALTLRADLRRPGVTTDVQADFLAGGVLGVALPRLLAHPPADPDVTAEQLWQLLRGDGGTTGHRMT